MALTVAGNLAAVILEHFPSILGIIRSVRRRFGQAQFVEQSMLELGVRFPFMTPPEIARTFAFSVQGMLAAEKLFGGSANAAQAALLAPINTLLFGSGATTSRYLYRAVGDVTMPDTGVTETVSVPVESEVPLTVEDVASQFDVGITTSTVVPTSLPGAAKPDLITTVVIGIDFIIRSF